jgi:hypothetical protein
MSRRQVVAVVVVAMLVGGCGVTVRTDRAAIGGGPEQATAQAQTRARVTAVTVATESAGKTAEPCECEVGK